MTTRVEPLKILFVCLGNICRSPAGEAILKHMAQKEGLSIDVKSCGLGDWHKGSVPDLRMRKAAEKRGYRLHGKAYAFQPTFYKDFDLILAADHSVIEALDSHPKLKLMTAFSPNYKNLDVPDPYHGNLEGFDTALDIIEDACLGLTAHIKENM